MLQKGTLTDMQEKMKARLRESRLLAPSCRWGESTQPSLWLFIQGSALAQQERNLSVELRQQDQ